MAHSNDTSYKPGEDHGGAILTEEQVLVIRDAPKYYGYRRDLAKRFGVTPHTIDDVRNGKSWRCVRDV